VAGNIDLTRRPAHVPHVVCAVGSAPCHAPPSTTLIAPLSLHGTWSSVMLEGATDRLAFATSIEHVLVPSLRLEQTVLMDNPSAHHSKQVEHLITVRGCELRFLPDFSPIEPACAKSGWHKVGACSVYEVVSASLPGIIPADARSFLWLPVCLASKSTFTRNAIEDPQAALDDGDWQRHRIALAGLARSAEAMPARFNRSAADLEPLLLRATRDLNSFNARRFAITALSYLRVITPEVLTALLRLVGDTQEVQDDALAAAGRFNRLHPSLGQALPQELVTALTDPSALRARAAIRLLEALGTSPVAQSAPGLRRQIVAALAAALQDSNGRRYVWVSAEKSDGTLDQDLYRALLRVAGF